jgi:hypothetical protein
MITLIILILKTTPPNLRVGRRGPLLARVIMEAVTISIMIMIVHQMVTFGMITLVPMATSHLGPLLAHNHWRR